MEHKDLLIAAAKAAGIDVFWHEEINRPIHTDTLTEWNPISSKADRWDLCERCGLTVDFTNGNVIAERSNPEDSEYFYFVVDDESQAIAVLKAAVASKGE